MAERIDVSHNATAFDRRHGAALDEDEVDRLWKAAGLHPRAAILDVGAGTGRVAIPLAARGGAVVALEPARGMVDAFCAKSTGFRIPVVIGEGGQLPFHAGAFEAVVMARLLYLARDWREILREAHRVLQGGGVVLHEWGGGQPDEEWVQIREQARHLFERAGVTEPFHPGVRSEVEVEAGLTTLGFFRASQLVVGPGPSMTVREFLRRVVEGEFSYTWAVPKHVLAECLPLLHAWSEKSFDLDRPIALPREISWIIFRKRAA